MHRDDWGSVYINQDKILKQLKHLQGKIFLAGGTGLQRFILPFSYRHSEDLDFFLEKLCTKAELDKIKDEIINSMSKLSESKLIEKRWIKDELAWRLFYEFEDNEEIIKIEILNFTCCRLEDFSFKNEKIFKTENLYNLQLYKFKALCDRPDTIKDLFDLYFILRDLGKIDIQLMMKNINKKFKDAIGIEYSKDDIISALNHRLEWDIEIDKDIKYIHDLKLEIDLFQKELKYSFENDKYLNFSYKSKIKQKAKNFDLSTNDYVNLVEDNQFIINEWQNYYEKETNN